MFRGLGWVEVSRKHGRKRGEEPEEPGHERVRQKDPRRRKVRRDQDIVMT